MRTRPGRRRPPLDWRAGLGGSESELLATDPPHVRVTHEIDGEAVVVDLDASLDVVAVEE